MGELLGIGISHYPGFIFADAEMSMRVKSTITSPKVPEHLKDPANWPAADAGEWADDEGRPSPRGTATSSSTACASRARRWTTFSRTSWSSSATTSTRTSRKTSSRRSACSSQDEFKTQPYSCAASPAPSTPPNVWEEPYDKTFVTPGHRQAAKYLDDGAASRTASTCPTPTRRCTTRASGHAFMQHRHVPRLRPHRLGLPHRAFQVNATAATWSAVRAVAAALFTATRPSTTRHAPSPKRCFDLGVAVAKVLKESPWRAAIIGSSSWSHAFLTDKNHWIFPDIDTDRARFEELKSGNYLAWRDLKLEQLEESGEQELLNWIPLAGAMHELGQRATLHRLHRELADEFVQVRGGVPAEVVEGLRVNGSEARSRGPVMRGADATKQSFARRRTIFGRLPTLALDPCALTIAPRQSVTPQVDQIDRAMRTHRLIDTSPKQL